MLLGRTLKGKANNQGIALYSLAILSYTLFSTLVKWQPFHSRLQMPFFVMATIPSVMVLTRFKKGVLFVNIIKFLSVPLALLLIFFNVLRPYVSYNLFYDFVKSYALNFRGIPGTFKGIPESFFSKPRTQQYFNSRPYYYKPYIDVMNALAKENNNASMVFDLPYGFEYPLWYLLREYDLDHRVIPKLQKTDNTIIVSTQEKPDKQLGYDTQCFKTDVEIQYSYVCILKPDYWRIY